MNKQTKGKTVYLSAKQLQEVKEKRENYFRGFKACMVLVVLPLTVIITVLLIN